VSQQLAALLIARQVIGNIKESALPYLLEQLRLAKLSFDMFGALSPSDEAKKELNDPSNTAEGTEEGVEDSQSQKKQVTNRNVSQAELETTLFKV
jgi:anoctamin-8